MSYRAKVDGCYIVWSPTLHEAHRHFHINPRFTLAKIGSSGDIFARVDSLNGLESYFSKVPKAIDPEGYGHASDWEPWRIRQERDGLNRSQLERTIQEGQPRLRREDWDSIHRRISNRTYLPKIQELFIVDIDRIQRLLPMTINDIVPTLRKIDRQLEDAFGDFEC